MDSVNEIITMPCYKSCKSMMTTACFESGNNDDKSDNNEDKICFFLNKMRLVNHVIDYILLIKKPLILRDN